MEPGLKFFKKPVFYSPLLLLIFFGSFCFLFFSNENLVPVNCANGKPDFIQYLTDNRLLVVSANETIGTYYHDQDFGYSNRQTTYLFEGYSFNLLDGATGKSINSLCWNRKMNEGIMSEKNAPYNNPANYTYLVNDSNEIFILFHPDRLKIADDSKVLSYVAHLKIQGDSIVTLPDVDLQGMSFELDNAKAVAGREDGYALLKNDFGESRYLIFSSGDITEKPGTVKSSVGKNNMQKGKPFQDVFFFCPKEEGSVRTSAFFMRYATPGSNTMFSYLADYKPLSAGARLKAKYFTDFSERPKYYPSDITNFSRPGIATDTVAIKSPERIKRIKSADGKDILFVEPSVLFYTDSTLLFMAKENNESILHYANTTQVIWNAPLQEADRKVILHETRDFVFIGIKNKQILF